MRQHQVDIQLGVDATSDAVLNLQPDAIVVATGALPDRTGYCSAIPTVPRIPGVDGANVFAAWDVLVSSDSAGSRVAVLDDDGGRLVAGVCEVLLDRGSTVELISRFTSLFPNTAHTLDMGPIYQRLLGKGLEYRLNSWVRRVSEEAVDVFNLYTGHDDRLVGVDAVVIATGAHANDGLYFELKNLHPQVHRVGDALAPRNLDHAIYEGYLAGRELLDDPSRYIVGGTLEAASVGASPLAATA